MRHVGRSLLVVVVVVLLGVGAIVAVRRDAAGEAGAEVERSDAGTVTYVVDGDTIDVEIAGTTERVRLLGIDTPESWVENGLPECYGPESFEHTRSRLPVGTTVRLERDVVARDDYGRLLAYVYRLPDDLLINADLLRNGFAELMVIRPNGAMVQDFRELTRLAEATGVGLWSACAG